MEQPAAPMEPKPAEPESDALPEEQPDAPLEPEPKPDSEPKPEMEHDDGEPAGLEKEMRTELQKIMDKLTGVTAATAALLEQPAPPEIGVEEWDALLEQARMLEQALGITSAHALESKGGMAPITDMIDKLLAESLEWEQRAKAAEQRAKAAEQRADKAEKELAELGLPAAEEAEVAWIAQYLQDLGDDLDGRLIMGSTNPERNLQSQMEMDMAEASEEYAQEHWCGFPSIDDGWHTDVGVLADILEEHFSVEIEDDSDGEETPSGTTSSDAGDLEDLLRISAQQIADEEPEQ